MSQKRGGGFNHYDNNRFKKPRPNTSQNPNFAPFDHSGHHGGRSQYGKPQKYKTKDNPVLEHIDRMPDPAKCEPCWLAAAELQTGMIALLDKVVAEELTPDGDRDVLHHARELRQLLSARAEKNNSSQPKKKLLDEKRPAKDQYVNVPAYIDQKLKRAKDLPPLPPITEPHLQEAVFTHISYHGQPGVRGIDDTDKLTYESLEFLGDAYIELFATRLIYSRLPHVPVPKQSHLREQLVRNETLGAFSTAYAISDRLKHGGHLVETKAWNKIVADVFEAYVAAVVLSDPENGFTTAENWLTELWAPQLLGYKEEVVENPRAKDDIQKMILVGGVNLNFREEKDMVHEQGVQRYFIGLYLTGWGYEDEWLGSGEGRNKAQAGVYAAMDALKRNSKILQDAAKQKQELIKRRSEDGVKEAQNQETGANGGDGKPEKEKTKLQDLLEIPMKDTQTNGSSWLEKEKKKKEKRERREKKKHKDVSEGSNL